jgi:4-carboxymuconolactone decarboxylase
MEVHKNSECLKKWANIIRINDTFDVHLIWIYMHAKRISKHELGMSVIHAIGDEGFNSLSAALDSLDPDFKRLLVEGAYADIIARPNLSLKRRELITVAVLTTIGNVDSALKYHAGGMLNTGWSPEALLETVLHTLLYAGVPAAMAGVRYVMELFEARGLEVRHEVNRCAQYESHIARLIQNRHAPSDALTPKDRQLATLAIVMALENQHEAVRQHLKACLHLGWTRKELTEVLIQLTGYIGWPLMLPLTRVAFDVFAAIEGGTSAVKASASPEREALGRNLGALSVSACVADISPEVACCLGELDVATPHFDSVVHARARHLTDIACLTCLARNADAEALDAHVRAALSLGASQREIVDAIINALPHAGVLAVESALRVARQLFAASDPGAVPEHESTTAPQSNGIARDVSGCLPSTPLVRTTQE